MRVKEIFPQLYLVKFPTQYEMCMTFLRVQEFYESPWKQFRGKFFVLENYMDYYAKRMGDFDYTSRWLGFNVPGNVFLNFFDSYGSMLRNKEEKLFDTLCKNGNLRKDFYVIGVSEDSVIDHETAHGFFYLIPEYRAQVIELVEALPKNFKKRFIKALMAKGYCKEVMTDEIHAYSIDCAMDGREYPDNLKVRASERKHFKPFLKLFRKYKRAYANRNRR